jgi:hypothetical protein
MKRVTLELGGKSPAILLDDAATDKAIPAALVLAFIVLHIDEQRRLDEVTRFEIFRMPLATHEHLRAFFDALADVSLDAFVLPLRHHRSDGSLGIGRITDAKDAHRVPYASLDFHRADSSARGDVSPATQACPLFI